MKNKLKILIVEDEVSIRNALKDKLTKEGFFTLEAKNGEEGLKIALQEKPDLILLDILMPVMNGLVMMDKLRETNVWGKSVPIFLLTNLSTYEKDILLSVLKSKPIYYLVKSTWKLQDVVEKIKEQLSPSV